jgi:hypothetical protein
LKAELSRPEQDWSLLEATQESLREHQARIKELEARRQWVGLTDGEIQCILDCGRGEFIAIKKAEQILKERNT